ncbi:MAG: hypothetical protein ABIK09_15780 [Pseudomonadota bacterium]
MLRRIVQGLSLVVISLSLGCGRDATPEPVGAVGDPPAVAAESEPAVGGPSTGRNRGVDAPPTVEPEPQPAQITATVGGLSPDPETPMGTVDVTFALPAGWGEGTAWGKGHWGPGDGDLAFSFDLSCNGDCNPAAIAGNLARGFDGFKDSAARPNFNSGDPAKDAIRATVEAAAEADLPNGRLLALRVTYSEEVLASGPYRPQLRLLCAWHTPGDAWYLTLDLRADLEPGEAILPALVDVCKSVEVKGPTPNEAEQRSPVILETARCELQSLPEATYTVDSKNSEDKPSVILLNQPVVIGGLPVAPIGRIYVEYNDDPITLRDVFTAADHTFKVGDMEITCLHRRPLRIDGSCALRRCILAREAAFGTFSVPPYSEITFETGPAGEAWVKRVHVPGGAVLRAGDQEHPGPGQAVFSEGAFQEWKPRS